MNLLFLSLADYETLQFHGLYSDLLRQFVNGGHEVYVVSPVERHKGKKTYVINEDHITLLKPRIFNMQKVGIFEKGISTITIKHQIIRVIEKYFANVKFDLILYTTPPITLAGVVEYVKKRDNAKTYLLLKDIFPQNAVDLGMMSKTGIKGLLYKYFRNKEKRLYALSDQIGCMSQANVDYVLKHNPEIPKERVEICPNSTDPIDMAVSSSQKLSMRKKYGIPQDKTVFIYGGNLGRPQGIPFLIECLKSQKDNDGAFFLIVGEGTEYNKLAQFTEESKQNNVKLMRKLPKEDYDHMAGSCDVGMIFLDHRFTIPNFPSRLLSCMQAKIPVLAVTDPNTDIGKVIVEGGFGWWCESNSIDMFDKMIKQSLTDDLKSKGDAGFQYLEKHYSASCGYEIIIKSISGI